MYCTREKGVPLYLLMAGDGMEYVCTVAQYQYLKRAVALEPVLITDRRRFRVFPAIMQGRNGIAVVGYLPKEA